MKEKTNRDLKKARLYAILEGSLWVVILALTLLLRDYGRSLLVGVILLLVIRNYITSSSLIRYRAMSEEVFAAIGEATAETKALVDELEAAKAEA